MNEKINMEAMVFETLFPIEVEVTIENDPYLLCEATNKQATKFKEAQAKATLFVNGAFAGAPTLSQTEALLVSYCLWDIKLGRTKDKRRPVPLPTIEGWPAPIVDALFERAREISRLKPKLDKASLLKQIKELQNMLEIIEGVKEDPSKNSSNGTGTSSSTPTDNASPSTPLSESPGG